MTDVRASLFDGQCDTLVRAVRHGRGLWVSYDAYLSAVRRLGGTVGDLLEVTYSASSPVYADIGGNLTRIG